MSAIRQDSPSPTREKWWEKLEKDQRKTIIIENRLKKNKCMQEKLLTIKCVDLRFCKTVSCLYIWECNISTGNDTKISGPQEWFNNDQ